MSYRPELLDRVRSALPKTRYDDPDICPECSGKNDCEIKDYCEGHESEISTVCKECGHAGYWAYGFFNSEYPNKATRCL